ncbi:MAG: hypothetical protein AAFQ63_09005 [Cyanobacteria bacterium J06621_11]
MTTQPFSKNKEQQRFELVQTILSSLLSTPASQQLYPPEEIATFAVSLADKTIARLYPEAELIQE